MEFGCAGVAFGEKIQATFATPALMISTTYIFHANGSFDNLSGRMLARLGGFSLTEKGISAI